MLTPDPRALSKVASSLQIELEDSSIQIDGPREQSSLLDKVLAKDRLSIASGERRFSTADGSSARTPLDDFASSTDFATLLCLWFGRNQIEKCLYRDPKWIADQLDRDIARIDALVEKQLSNILHAKPFQKLEASWRGIQYLVETREDHPDARIAIRILNVSWGELKQDFEGASEFDQSQLFRKVYEEGLGQPGADPFSCLIADYSIHPRLTSDHRYDDMHILRGLSSVAAAAFCPLIANAHPSMMSVDRFSDLRSGLDVQSLHSSLDFFAWQRFRETEDSRFVSLALPHILMRRPYRDETDHGFPFTERVVESDDYLWGGAAFAMGEVLIRSFAESGWFANIRGAQRGAVGGGMVIGPAKDPFNTEPHQNAARTITDVSFADSFERSLSSAGFLPLCACKDVPMAAFYSSTSAQAPKSYSTLEATMSAKLSTMLNYILCVSRFGHFLKIIARQKIGSCNTPDELQDILQRWITNYVTPDPEASATTRLKKPLLEANIQVHEIPGRPGEYESIFHLVPHHELDDMRVSIRLDTKLLPQRS